MNLYYVTCSNVQRINYMPRDVYTIRVYANSHKEAMEKVAKIAPVVIRSYKATI